MAEYFYTTIENQIRHDGSMGLLYDHFEGTVNSLTAEERAWAKLYNILAAAAISGIPYHSGHILRSDGLIVDGKVFDRRVEVVPAANDSEEIPEEGE